MSDQDTYGFWGGIRHELENQIQDRLTLLQLDVTEKTARLVGIMATMMLAALLFFFVMMFLSLMAGYYFSQRFDSFFAGYAIVAGFYIVLFLVLAIWGRHRLSRFITNKVVEIIFEKTAEHPS